MQGAISQLYRPQQLLLLQLQTPQVSEERLNLSKIHPLRLLKRQSHLIIHHPNRRSRQRLQVNFQLPVLTSLEKDALQLIEQYHLLQVPRHRL